MKFAVITDIHLGEEKGFKGIIQKMSRYSLPFLKDFVQKMNNNFKPAFVVNLGDAINDVSSEDDAKNLNIVLSEMKKLKCRFYTLAGNHEQRCLKKEELQTILALDSLYYSFDIKDYHFVVLFSEDYEKVTPAIPPKQIDWLKQDLSNTNKPTIVFIHHVLSDQDLTGNIWFEGKSYRSLVSNREEVRIILEDSKKVIAVFNGHNHWNKMDIHNGIPYFSIQSLVENFKKENKPSESYALVNLNKTDVSVEVVGNDCVNYSHKGNNPS